MDQQTTAYRLRRARPDEVPHGDGLRVQARALRRRELGEVGPPPGRGGPR